MESITIKVEGDMAKEIDKAMKPFYSTKTEFIREAIREKLLILRKEHAIDGLQKFFGAAKTRASYEEERNIRESVSKQFVKKFGIKL